ncbi:MAG TPA: hypothetical protein PLN83_11050 [Syntrophorhabdus sp.]|mgnify:CR=1 FL=1|nr:hypothetical protein [Syntrophorhabdus sp.]HQP56637.1 hypothetical protein [Syntrophorhabdus sp.]
MPPAVNFERFTVGGFTILPFLSNTGSPPAKLGVYLDEITLFWSGTLKIRGLELSKPPLRFLLPQIFIAILDSTIACSVLFAILPSGVDLTVFLGIFLIAQLAGIISQIPAGLGVFDAVIIIFLTRYFPAYSILASLIVYRAIYYIIPLVPAIAMLAILEAID